MSAIKGQEESVLLLANSGRNRQIRPTQDLLAWYGSDRVTMSAKTLQECFDEASRLPSHNEAADQFRMSVIEAFSQLVYNPSFDNYGEAYRSFAASPSLKVFLLKHWPTLTPEQALNDLVGSPALLRKAATGSGLSRAQVALLARDRVPEMELEDNRWSDADIPLLDELWHLVGGLPSAMAEEDRQRVRDARDEFEIAAMQDQSLEDDDGEPVEDEAAEILSGLVLPPPPIRGDFV